MTVKTVMTWQEQVLQWLWDNERPKSWIARHVHIHPTYFSHLLSNRRVPSNELLRRIEELTGLKFNTNGTENK